MQSRVGGFARELSQAEGNATQILGGELVLVLEEDDTVVRDDDG